MAFRPSSVACGGCWPGGTSTTRRWWGRRCSSRRTTSSRSRSSVTGRVPQHSISPASTRSWEGRSTGSPRACWCSTRTGSHWRRGRSITPSPESRTSATPRTPSSSTGEPGTRSYRRYSSDITCVPKAGTSRPGSTSSTRSGTGAGTAPASSLVRTGSGTRWRSWPGRSPNGSGGRSSARWTTPLQRCYGRVTDAPSSPQGSPIRGRSQEKGPLSSASPLDRHDHARPIHRSLRDVRAVSRRAVLHRERERLGGNVGRVLVEGSADLAGAVHPEADPVGDVEAGRLPRVLYHPDQLPGQALAPEVVVELELERDGHAALGGNAPALADLLRQVRVAGASEISSPSSSR